MKVCLTISDAIVNRFKSDARARSFNDQSDILWTDLVRDALASHIKVLEADSSFPVCPPELRAEVLRKASIDIEDGTDERN